MFSSLQNLKKYTRDPARFKEKLENAKKHIRFCVDLYRMQIEGSRYFLHEHPRRATSWQMFGIVRLAATPGVESTVCDMCAYGMQITDKNGNALVEKSTQFLTNAPEVCKRISQRCSNRKESW